MPSTRVWKFAQVPMLSLIAPCGGFVTDNDVRVDETFPVPAHLMTPRASYAVLRTRGDSMRGRIPAGSVCLMKRVEGGGYEGKIVLARRIADGDISWTLKYWVDLDGIVSLRPTNPEYPAMPVEDDGYAPVMEFVCVLPRVDDFHLPARTSTALALLCARCGSAMSEFGCLCSTSV
jgi:SOS-response transcriptional repressor LexA